LVLPFASAAHSFSKKRVSHSGGFQEKLFANLKPNTAVFAYNLVGQELWSSGKAGTFAVSYC